MDGWTYIYTGDQAMAGAGFAALDGTWSHENGSDEWDETEIGTGRPGGVTGGLMDGDTVYARFQETGDPRDHGFDDPGSNRKLYFGHDISAEGATETIIDDGVTLSFRSRVSTGGMLDDQHPDGGGAIDPWPEEGIGYNLHNGSKSTFTIKQASGGSVSFALGLPSSEGTPTPGLITNNLNGTEITGDVDGPDDPGDANFLPVSDATAWHEFWITIESNGDEADGTHQVQIWRDGTAVPATFDVTAGDGSDYSDISYLAMGLGATPRTGAIDVDFFSWAPGVILPVDEIPAPGDFNVDGSVTTDDYFILSDNMYLHLTDEVFFESGDIDVDGDVDFDDFGQFKELFPGVVAAAQAIPEPGTLMLCSILLGAWAIVRSRKQVAKVVSLLVVVGFLFQGAENSALAQGDVEWEGPSGMAGDYADGSNWSTNFVPDGMFVLGPEDAVINNGGIAQVSTAIATAPEDVRLAQDPADSGTLEILSGGSLPVLADFHVGDDSDDSGGEPLGGEGHLIVHPGGTLDVGDDFRNRGAATSSVVLGGSAAGTAMVTIAGDAELRRNLRVIGPNVSFTSGNLILGDEGTLTAEITGPDHSPLASTGGATLGGVLDVEFNGHTPTAGDAWPLVDAASIGGSFSAINTDIDVDPGFGFFVDTQAGGTNGQVATLAFGARLQLAIDPDSGAAAIRNLTTSESFDIDGYEVISLDNGLTPDGWTSVEDGGDADWRESGSDAIRLGETNLTGSMVIGPESSISLGNIFDPPGADATLDGVSFLYHEAGGATRSGILALADLEPDGEIVDGDYSNNGQVEQADLDLVLLNWGESFENLPAEWINQRPTMGIVDQAELDGVLLNWGNTAALGAAAAVPEPATCVLLVVAAFGATLIRRR